MRSLSLAAAAALILVMISSPSMLSRAAGAADTMQSGTAPIDDATFVRKAAISDMYEIQAGKLAQQKGVTADTKTFASKMVDAHTETSNKLKSILASKAGPKPPADMDAEHKALIAKLRSASGSQFDKLYAKQQVQAHNDAVMLFTDYAQNGKDAEMKKFANGTLPVIQQHLSMAQALEKGGGVP